MRKLLAFCAVVASLFVASNVYSDDNHGGNNCCPPDAPCDQPVDDCWCRYVHWEPCYYETQRCVEVQIPCQKQCCRMVPKYYQVTRCKYVPQYYTETVCRYEPDYYCVPDCKTEQRTVCDKHCKYVPRYYWKHICGKVDCANPCPAQN